MTLRTGARFAAVHGTVWEQMQGWLQNLELALRDARSNWRAGCRSWRAA
jgi:hypothetical protein